MEKFTQLTSRLVPLAVNDIDTDQIIPARFLKVTDKNGLGDNLFADWRYDQDGKPKPDFALNKPKNQGAQVLLTADNFGCGSSREHAPWALMGFGFRAVIATSFADIFYNNAAKNGLLLVKVSPQVQQKLAALRDADADVEVTIDLETQTLTLPDGEKVTFPVDSFSRMCMLKGKDQLEYILSFKEDIKAYEEQRGITAAA